MTGKKKLGLLYDILTGVSLKIYQRLICCVDPKETKTYIVLIFVIEKNRDSRHRLDIYIYIYKTQNDVVLVPKRSKRRCFDFVTKKGLLCNLEDEEDDLCD